MAEKRSKGLPVRIAVSGLDFIYTVLQTAHWREREAEPRMRIVVESGHTNAPDLVRLYNGIKEKFGGVANKTLAGLTFEPKSTCLPFGTGRPVSLQTRSRAHSLIDSLP